MHPGDPACWSHLTCERCRHIHAPDAACKADAGGNVPTTAGPLDRGSAGLASTQLNATCVALDAGRSLPPAVLDRDVAFVVTRGSGTLRLEGDHPRTFELVPARTVLVPAGSRRVLEAGPDGLAWTSVHLRREVS